MKYEIGQLLTFNVYGSIVKGEFVSIEDNLITIKTTCDFLGGIGDEQSINEQHLKKPD